MIHDFVKEKIPAYALGALDPDELPDLEQHLRDCPRCRERLARYLRLRDALNVSVPDAPLPDGFTERLVERAIPFETALAPRMMPRPTPAPPAPARSSRLPWALAAACLLIALAAGARALQLDRELDRRAARVDAVSIFMAQPGLRHIELESRQPSAAGRLYVGRDGRSGVVWCRGMTPNREGEQYQLWLTRRDEQWSGGALTLRGDGYYAWIRPQRGVRAYDRFMLTVEPVGGSRITGRPVMSADL